MLPLLAFALILPGQESPLRQQILDAEQEARQHLDAGRLDLAETQALHAIELSQNTNWMAYNGYMIAGQVYLERGENRRAFTWLEQYYRLSKTSQFHGLLLSVAAFRARNDSWARLWIAWKKMGWIDDVVGGTSTLPGIDSQSATEASFLIVLAEQSERPLPLAVKDITKALELAPDNSAAIYVKAGLLLKQNKKDEARQILSDLLPKTSGKLHHLVEARLKLAEA